MDAPDDPGRTEGSETIRDVSRMVLPHPVPIYDPVWLRRLHDRCLWDGGASFGSDFCSSRCEERYMDWENRTTHVIIGREPLQTFFEYGMVNP